ncbi:hypothetical protein RFI_08145 [Reticulomyxa filosa]|uniref:Uncharacterized protein n=1 Tax=Reticulomyxa filosa TaxID=46433 RepID=X6NSL2_RETFI|nr:hypothetical protein RFI_08145 [Reticulomyxa filosa]|eukprot:ETO28981.1 hypothetical protein RFI_08145 [Reticulomyxa filosa]
MIAHQATFQAGGNLFIGGNNMSQTLNIRGTILNILGTDEMLMQMLLYLETRMKYLRPDSNFAIGSVIFGNKKLNGDHKQDVVAQSATSITYAVYAFVALCCITAVLAKIHEAYMGTDTLRSAGLVFFGLYAWDFYSDAVFIVRLAQVGAWYLFLVGMAFLVIPYVLNLKHLLAFQKQWMADPAMSERLTSWLINYSRFLISTTMISGSVFAAIELFNTNLFGLEVMSMGLPERQLKKSAVERLYSNILFENLPQILIQFFYSYFYSNAFDGGKIDRVVIYAFASSIVSIVIALIDLWTSLELIQSMKEDNIFFGKGATSGENPLTNKTFFFFIEDEEIVEKKHMLRQKHWGLREALGESLEVHPRTIELTQLVPSTEGLKVGFTVFTNFKTKNELTLALLDSFVSGAFCKNVMNNIQKVVLIGGGGKKKERIESHNAYVYKNDYQICGLFCVLNCDEIKVWCILTEQSIMTLTQAE